MAAAMNWLEWVLNMMRSLRPLEYGESNEFVIMAAEWERVVSYIHQVIILADFLGNLEVVYD